MENQTQAPVERKKLADGIYEGDLLLLELTNGQFFRGWLQDLLLGSDGKPSAFKTDQGMVDLAQVKLIRIGQIKYVALEEIIESDKLAAEKAASEAPKEVAEVEATPEA